MKITQERLYDAIPQRDSCSSLPTPRFLHVSHCSCGDIHERNQKFAKKNPIVARKQRACAWIPFGGSQRKCSKRETKTWLQTRPKQARHRAFPPNEWDCNESKAISPTPRETRTSSESLKPAREALRPLADRRWPRVEVLKTTSWKAVPTAEARNRLQRAATRRTCGTCCPAPPTAHRRSRCH